MIPENEIEAEKLTEKTDFLPSDGSSCCVSLTREEAQILKNHYLHWAHKWEQSESTNIRLADRADPQEIRSFLTGPLNGRPQTPKNWLKRAKIFRQQKELCLTRAAKFSPHNVQSPPPGAPGGHKLKEDVIAR